MRERVLRRLCMKYRLFLVVAFVVAWVWAAIEPLHPRDWLLENYLVFIFVPIIFLLGRWFRLSNISYTLITAFAILHVIGSHYTYAEVPFGDTLQMWLGANRNMYDRFVHFLFGLLIAYPVREIFLRVAHAKGFWGYFMPIDLVFALSAIYEIIEWGVVAISEVSDGLDFLGSQGDIWDAQKDMALAGLGSILAMAMVALAEMHYSRDFWKKIKNSVKLSKNDRPLGEESIKEAVK